MDFFFFLIELQLIYNVVLISAVQQRDSVMHIYSFSYSFPLWFFFFYKIDHCNHFIYFLEMLIYLFIYGCVGSSLLHAGFL